RPARLPAVAAALFRYAARGERLQGAQVAPVDPASQQQGHTNSAAAASADDADSLSFRLDREARYCAPGWVFNSLGVRYWLGHDHGLLRRRHAPVFFHRRKKFGRSL